MSGVTPLIDTLLATRLAQRVDLVPLKGQIDIGGTSAPTPLQKVSNDVRLSSREGLQQQLAVGAGVSTESPSGQGALAKNLDTNVTLSAVARALTALLDSPASQPSRLVATAALWPDLSTPGTPQLAAKLAQAVAGSGLFYEAHLKQFAAGTRTLAQVADEPQAQLNRQPAAALPSPEAQELAAVSSDKSATVHPEALGLVRQQLELLAQPLLRWSGQAWSGAAMDWDITEEQDERQGAADDPAPARRWHTRLALSLPTLGQVEARLSLDGNTLQLQMRAAEQATVSLLNAAGTELPRHLEAQGLQLAGLHIHGLEPSA